MKRRSFLGASAGAAGTACVAGPGPRDDGHDMRDAHANNSHQSLHSVPPIAETANHLIAALTPEQQRQAMFPFDADERMNWHFIPRERKGLPLRAMSPHQKHLACALLSAGLSQRGFIKAVTIMSLEDVLRLIENDSGERRNPENYYFSIFGTPSGGGPWGYRVEGHHLSQNYTIVNGIAVDAPSFFGSNPAEVRHGPRNGLRTLAREEDLGMEMVRSLDDRQRSITIVSPTAYNDIVTAASREAALRGQPTGLSSARMTPRQQEALLALMDEYATNVPGSIAEGRMEQIRQAGRNLFFAWAGSVDRASPHYYRVQAPSFLIEFDNTQNGANHIHSVWRDFTNDFGRDLLGEHYRSSHAKK
jgi:hypothetical protein